MSKASDQKPSMVIVVVLLVVVIGGFIFLSYNNKSKVVNAEYFTEQQESPIPKETSVAHNSRASPETAAGGLGNYAASDPNGNESYNPVQGAGYADYNDTASPTPSCFPRDRLSADDLLPRDAANERWAQMNPAGQGDVQDQNFLTAGYHIGINTQGSSLKNANLQLRSEPPNPQLPVSPWNISTITPDMMRKPLEIGGDF